MDEQPPNNHNNENNGRRAKEAAVARNGNNVNENGEMDIFGNLEDSGPIVFLFFMGLMSFLLRDTCTC